MTLKESEKWSKKDEQEVEQTHSEKPPLSRILNLKEMEVRISPHIQW